MFCRYISDFLAGAVESVGPELVRVVVQDGASACVNAGELLELQYPHLFAIKCAAHGADLWMKDISGKSMKQKIRVGGYFQKVKGHVAQCMNVINVVKFSQAIFAEYKTHTPLRLLQPAGTRFCSLFLMTARLVKVHEALERTVISAAWKTYYDKADSKKKAKMDMAKDYVRNALAWVQLQELVDVTAPVLKIVRLLDGDTPCNGKVYEACHAVWAGMPESSPSGLFNLKELQYMKKLWKERWDHRIHNHIHGFCYAVDPEFHVCQEICDNPDVRAGVQAVFLKASLF
jgi:hypothetical protein